MPAKSTTASSIPALLVKCAVSNRVSIMAYHGMNSTLAIATTIGILMLHRCERQKRGSKQLQSDVLATDAGSISRKMGVAITCGVRGVSMIGIGTL